MCGAKSCCRDDAERADPAQSGSCPIDADGWRGLACLGLRLVPADVRDARLYLEALDYPPWDAAVVAVPDWQRAEAVTRDPQWDRTWWAREEDERARLMRVTRDRVGDDALLERLTAATEMASQSIYGAAAIAAE